MYLFAGIFDQLQTASIDDSVLPGVTRDSLIMLARDSGWRVVERSMSMAELLGQLSSGECSKVFACGTAAIVCPISVIGDTDGREYRPGVIDGRARVLRERVLAIQERRGADADGGTRGVIPLVRPDRD